MLKPAYKRILLKLSGESLMGDQSFGVDPEACFRIASQVKELAQLGIQISIVIGGGNIFRGAHAAKLCMDRAPADHIGMLATFINGISLQQSFQRVSCESRVLSAIACAGMAEPYSWVLANQYLQEGKILIFVGGTGNPFFTTDSAAALRALETEAEVVLKGTTRVDGIYNKDPIKHPEAVKYERVTYNEVLAQKLEVMDPTAIALCRENSIPIRVFNVFSENALMRAVQNQSVGTLVVEES